MSKIQIPITEVFRSLQGEASLCGKPMYFIRLWGCPVRCKNCDTPFSWVRGSKFKKVDLETFSLPQDGDEYVCVTGGEPSAIPSTEYLIERLIEWGYKVLVITAGWKYQSWIYQNPDVHVYLDPKPPSMMVEDAGEVDKCLKALLPPHHEVKTIFDVYSSEDRKWICDINERIPKAVGHTIQPFNPNIDRKVGDESYITRLRETTEWVLDQKWKNPPRVLPQLHLIMWGNERAK